jgi:3-oxoisoapionate decarboxylase
MNRRDFLVMTTAALSVGAGGMSVDERRSSMGVVQYSFSRSDKTKSALEFLEYCHSLGAGGVQITLDSTAPEYAAKLRRRSQELGMYLEAILPLPQADKLADFEQGVAAAKLAGALCLRSACLPTRRYETFTTLEEWRRFTVESRQRLRAVLPIMERQQLPLGIENHKDWIADELVALLSEFSSEWLGACVDTGNNLALLEDPMEVVEKLAPYTVTTHIKDMAADEFQDGFRIAEVPCGKGVLDLKRIVTMISGSRPKARFSLEMITRDPLQIPCLTDKYWATFPDRHAVDLARGLRWIRSHKRSEPLPQISALDPAARVGVEEQNVRNCLRYAHDTLGLVTA